jgi:group I intron endonuclease
MKKTKYKIYKLIDPLTNKIRYVGRTSQNLDNRLKKHLNAKDKSHRTNWIKNLLLKNLVPKIELICETDKFETCTELEFFYIKKYKELGFDLVNMTNGGEGSIGFKHSESTIIKMKNAAKIRASNQQYRNSISKKLSDNWVKLSDDLKNQHILKQPNRKNIGQFDLNDNLIREFISLRQIERELGYFRANITPCLKGLFKQAYGFNWKYLE